MKKTLALFLTLAFLRLTVAQNVTVVEHDLTHVTTVVGGGFQYVADTVLVAGKARIALLKGTCINQKRESLTRLFSQFRESAGSFGANAFRIDSVSMDSALFSTVYVSVFTLTDQEVEVNAGSYGQNMIYVVGNPDGTVKKGKAFRLNGEKLHLMPLHYVAVQNRPGQETTLSVGGFMGAKTWIKWREGRKPEFFVLEGFGIGGAAMMPGQIGLSFNTGRIEKIDMNLGHFLISVMKPQVLEAL